MPKSFSLKPKGRHCDDISHRSSKHQSAARPARRLIVLVPKHCSKLRCHTGAGAASSSAKCISPRSWKCGGLFRIECVRVVCARRNDKHTSPPQCLLQGLPVLLSYGLPPLRIILFRRMSFIAVRRADCWSVHLLKVRPGRKLWIFMTMALK